MAGRRGCYPLLIARSTRALGAQAIVTWSERRLVYGSLRFDSARWLQPWQAAQKKLPALRRVYRWSVAGPSNQHDGIVTRTRHRLRASVVIQRSPEKRENVVRIDGSRL